MLLQLAFKNLPKARKKMREKIVLIGAGSAMFTRGLVSDLLKSGMKTDLALVDIDPTALETARCLVEKMIAARNVPIHIEASLDRRTVLKGATIVITTIGVGSRRAWEQDVFVPRRYGLFYPVGDTAGPGGSSRALRMIPPMVEIARDILDLAPDALFFNYGNPMSPVCRAVIKATGAPVTGLCHGTHHTSLYLADKLGVPLEHLTFNAVGINHMTWFTEVWVNGEDAMPRLRELAAQKMAQLSARQVGSPAFESTLDHPFSWQCLLWFGGFPAPLDRHVTEFFPQFFRDGRYYGKVLGVDEFSFEDTIAVGDHIYAEMQSDASSPEPLPADYFEKLGGEHEQVIDIIQSIRANKAAIFSANLPNIGQFPQLPLQAIVEAPAVSNGFGLHHLAQQKPLPTALVGTLATRFQWVETIVEAALEASRDKFIQALILDGCVASPDHAARLADDLLAAQRLKLS
jgi:alpha-galactosidase